MVYIYVAFDKEWFEKNKEKFSEKWKEEIAESEGYIIRTDEAGIADLDVDRDANEIYVMLEYPSDSGEGITVAVRIPIDIDMMIDLIEIATKKLNKLKTVMEALK